MEWNFGAVLVHVVGMVSWEGWCERRDEEIGLVVDEEGGNGMGR